MTEDLSSQIAANKRRTALLLGIFFVVVAGVIWTVSLLLGHPGVGLVVAVLVAGTSAALAWAKSEHVALAVSRAQAADALTYARLHNLVEGLCVAAGLPKPRLYVVDDGAANAFATGRGPRSAAVVVTTGMLDAMSRVELEAVLAHELSHIKNHDVLVSTLAVTMVGLPLRPLGSLLSRVMVLAVGRRRELVADTTGVALTRYPPGLIAAMEKLQATGTVVKSSSPATAHLWIESPLADRGGSGGPSSAERPFATHPPLDERIRALKEL